ncbi:MAG: type IX secretion system membrane protein PorP/SprF [Dysgonamonadaceae bacterium]|jgi:type IX secretion system PorP/SprF family membrane protein|nr:type IX secretion system membrane protein PorP/SprF [Dysgonamonadaceae bacterium]
MMKKAVIVSLILLFSVGQSLWAQFDTQLSNYWAAPNYYNPGYAGQSGKLELTGLYRMQWLGIEHAPKSGILLGEMPLSLMGKEHGVGLSMYNDQTGLFQSTVISGQFALKIKLFGGSLGLGIQGGYIAESFDGTKVDIPDDDTHSSTDPAIPAAQVEGTSIDAAFGIYYTDSLKRWYVGLSATHLLSPALELNENYVLDIPRSYYFTAGYNIELNNPLLELRPSVLLKTTEMSSLYVNRDSLVVSTKPNTLKGMLRQTQVDVSLRMVYNKMFWGGLSWRKGESLIFMLGGQFKMVEVGYAYDVPVFSDLIRTTSGSHELFIKYVVDMNFKKGSKSKHKSVRIL